VAGIKEIGCEHVDWIHVDRERVSWWNLVTTVRNLQFHERQIIS
jgi:hypothetical protein